MSPTNFFFDFDNLFQTNPAERFITDELESFDEEFAALLSSFVNITPLPSATPMVKQDLPEKAFEQTGEIFAGLPQTPVGFDSAIENGKVSAQEFPTINQVLQPSIFVRREKIELRRSDDTPLEPRSSDDTPIEPLPSDDTPPPTKVKASDTVEVEKSFPPIQSDDSPQLPEVSDDTPRIIRDDAPQVKSDSIVAESIISEPQNRFDFSPPALDQSGRIEMQKRSDLPVQTNLHGGIEPKNVDNSKKILTIDKDVEIERQKKSSKQFEFEKKKQFIPIFQAEAVTETAKPPKTSASFQTVLGNFTEFNESPAPLKKIKLESVSTGFYEQFPSQENFAKELSFTESQPIAFEQFVENVPEQVIEPMIVLAKETGKPDATRTVKIKLNPEELGTVEISLEGTASGKLHAELVTETKTAEAVLNQNIGELQKALEYSGWQIETLTISCNDTNSGQSEKQSQQAEKPQNFDNSLFSPESETVPTEADDRLLSVRA